MSKLIVFNSISLDGYFTGVNGDLSWAHGGNDDAEYNAFIAGNASGDGQLLFGRIIYEMMASFWPTPNAMKTFPKVAEGMNCSQKIVFSRTLNQVTWNNTRLMKGDLVSEVRKLKNQSEKGIAILGSGSIVSQLAPESLIDEYQFLLNPAVLGKGRTMFDGLENKINLKLTNSRIFKNGKLYLCYQPIA
jgi:dihydrofolate reductase